MPAPSRPRPAPPGRLAPVALAVLAAATVAALAPAASAAPATLKGRVVGPTLPDHESGLASVQAIEAKTGVVRGADFTGGRRDRWRLRVAPGAYVLGAATVPFAGGKVVDRLVAFARARSGRTTKLKLRLKRKRKRGHRAGTADRPAASRVADGFGDVDVGHPAIWVKQWDVRSPNPELGVLRKGMADMLITDLVAGFAQASCDAIIVERDRIEEVLDEHRLQRLPGFDPGTTIRPGRLIRDNASVTGTLTEAGGQLKLSATYSDRRNGRTRAVSVQGPGEALFALEQKLAEKLVEVICDPVDEIAGTFEQRIDAAGSVFTYSGNVTFTRSTPAVLPGANGTYDVSSGRYTVTASGRDVSGATGCRQSGSKQFTIPSGNGDIAVFSTQPTLLEPYQYSLSIFAGGPTDRMNITLSGCPSGAADYEGHVWQNWPLGALSFSTDRTYTSDDGINFAGTRSQRSGGFSLEQSWSLRATE